MFITFEGPEGSGKTSHVKPLAEWLAGQGYRVHTAREPGGTSISEQIRAVIHDLKNTEMNARTETLLYQAARAQIVEQVIKPKLAEGYIVLCDRYADSTLAYQGYGHQQNLDEVRALVRYATGGLTPDLTILLDLAVEVGLKRKTKNKSEWNRLDAYDLGFHRRVRAGYLEMVKQEPGRWVVVDAGQEWNVVQEQLRGTISGRNYGLPLGEQSMIRVPTSRAPTHPGEMLLEEFLAPMGITQRELAHAIHVPYQRVNDLVNGRRGVTTSTALRLAKFFGTSPDFWMNLQLRWDLYFAQEQETRVLETIQPHIPVTATAA